MLSKQEIRDFLIKNCMDADGDLDLSDLDFSEFHCNVLINGMIVDGNLYQSDQEVSGKLYQGHCVVKGTLDQHGHIVDGNLDQGMQTVHGTLWQDRQEVDGNIYL